MRRLRLLLAATGQVVNQANAISGYEMLTGELPLGRFAPPSRKAGVDARLDGIVFRALERELERRYQRFTEVMADLESLRAGAASPLGTSRPRMWLVERNVHGVELRQIEVELPTRSVKLVIAMRINCRVPNSDTLLVGEKNVVNRPEPSSSHLLSCPDGTSGLGLVTGSLRPGGTPALFSGYAAR